MRGSKLVSILLMLVLFEMSACLILQAAAAEHNVPLCHASGPAKQGGSRKSADMERCCQSGIFKASQKFVAGLQTIGYVPDSTLIFDPQSAHFHLVFHGKSAFLSPPDTTRRLAELSLLRI